MKILVYVPSITPRVKYAFRLLFRSCLKANYKLTARRDHYVAATGPKVNYSPAPIGKGELWVPAGPLLWQNDIQQQQIELFHVHGLPAFFRQEATGAAVPFDLPALAFFMASRYEEYLPFTADAMGRFPASQSLAYRGGFLEQPIVNQWALYFAQLLEQHFPGLRIPRPAYRFLPTYDVDMAWAYLHRPLWLNLAGTLRELATARWEMAYYRWSCLLGKRPDPFDTFADIRQLHHQEGLPAIFFFLLGDHNRYDKNTPFTHPALHKLIVRLADTRMVGIHPSYASNHKEGQLHEEVRRLNKIIGENVVRSRQHFLLLRFPDTYRQLIEQGIQEDYSMGYADAVGFRTGLSTSFSWYDLDKEQSQPLTIFPFAAMDVTLRKYMALAPEEALERLWKLCRHSRETGGIFITLWHNSSFSEIHGWRGWQEVYKETVGFAIRPKSRLS